MTPLTELELVLEHYLGEPNRRRGNGESEWDCPHCGHARFHTMPLLVPFKHRAKCWCCGFRGDVFDMLLEFHPNESYANRCHRLSELRAEFKARKSSVPFSSGERRGEPREADRRALDLALTNLMDDFRDEETNPAFALQILSEAVKRCAEFRVRVPDFVTHWQDCEDWLVDSDRRHFVSCDDPDCEAIVCRASRGLPPLTPDEIEAGRIQSQRQSRVRRTLKNGRA